MSSNTFKLFYLFSSILIVSASVSDQKTNKIFGGKPAKDGQFPYMVDLSVKYRGRFFHICGASLIHYNWIITAGHCADYVIKNNFKLNATFGVTDITNGPHKYSELIAHENIIIHENYSDNADTASNDVALLKTNKPILYGAKILPIRLPSNSDVNTFEGESAILCGWGLDLNRKKGDQNVLQYYEEIILSNDECSAQNFYYPKIVNSEICVSSKNGKTACPGDSGSPLVVKNDTLGEVLVGIASYVNIGKFCDSDNNGPVVFMRVSYYMDWIEEKTGMEF